LIASGGQQYGWWEGTGLMEKFNQTGEAQVMGHSSKQTKCLQRKALFNTMELYSHTQPSTGWPDLH